jgi:DNA-binding MarR family transcriptional regulator
MDPLIEAQSRRLESILPMILRTIYPPREDDPFAELPLMQLRVLRSLSDGRRSMSDLAEELRMSASRLTHLLTRLETAGLVEKTHDLEDRRVKYIDLTPKGMSQMETHRSLRSGRAGDILATLSKADRDALMDSLEKLYAHAKTVSLAAAIGHEAESVR